jgi:diguanylate cyclase (GGDEF)-like protein
VRELGRSLLPGAAAVATAALAATLPAVRAPLGSFLVAYPVLVPGLGVLLAVAFRRRGAMVVLLVLAACAWWLPPGEGGGDGGAGDFAFGAMALLLPANLLIASLIRDRGVLISGTFAWVAVVGGQVALVAFLWEAYGPDVTGLLHALGKAPLPGGDTLPPAVVVLFALAFVASAVRLVRRPGPVEGGVLLAVVGAYWGLAPGAVRPATPVLLAGAAAAVIVSLLAAAVQGAYGDELTGLPGRRALEEALEALKGTYTVALVDVDHFKLVNDRHGHPVGDQVLRLVATRLREVGGGGRAYRYGGEEFALLFPARPLAVVEPYLEAARTAIARAEFRLRGPDRPAKRPRAPRAAPPNRPVLAVTVSIGAAQPRTPGESPREVLARADAALYRAKRSGRDRVVV